jgi:putative ABC transport system permease protein
MPGRLLQLVLGSALVVVLICLAAAFDTGMARGLAATGDARNVIILGAGSEDSVERSEVPAATPGIVAASIPGLALVAGRPAVSPEVVYNGLVKVGNRAPTRALLRGITPMAMAVHRAVRLTSGHLPGPDEILVGTRAATLLGCDERELAIGRTLRFEDRDLTICGRFVAPDSVLEAELWLDLTELMTATKRNTLSAVVVRLGEADLGAVDLFCAARLDLELVALTEVDYYHKLDSFFTPIALMTWITAVLVAAGAIFGGLNTFYAAFAARMAELATLQVVDFHRWMILMSLLQEGLMATTLGTLVALTTLLLGADGLGVSFSTFVFTLSIGDEVLLLGLSTGLVLGIIGTLPPAWRCLSSDLPKALAA